MKRAALLVLAATLGACAEDLGLSTTPFACATNADCARGTLCHPLEGICRPPDHDAGVARDAGADAAIAPRDAEATPDAEVPPDAGLPADAGSIPKEPSAGVAWCWVHGQSASDLERLLREKNGRILDVDLEETSPSLRYTAVIVENTGAQEKRWWWVPDGAGDEVAGVINGFGARIVDLEPYLDARRSLRFAAVLIANAGADASGWWWYYSQTPESLAGHLATNRARLIDVDTYGEGAARRLSGLMVPNGDNRAWAWDDARTPAEITSTAAASRASVIVLEPSRTSSQTFAFVVERRPRFTSTTLFDATAEEVDRASTGEGRRVLQVSAKDTPAGRRWSAVLTENLSAPSARVRDLVRATSSGPIALHLEEPGVNLRAGFHLDEPLTPGAAIHTLLLLHAIRSGASLDRAIPVYADPPPGGCPMGPMTGTEPLSDALRAMMAGDGNRARAIADALGLPAIARTATELGMQRTTLSGPPGCPSAMVTTTARDLAALAMGAAASTSSAAIFALMPAAPAVGDRDGIEAALRALAGAEGRTARLGAAALEAFTHGAAVHAMSGAGVVAGVFEIPRCVAGRPIRRVFTMVLAVPAAAFDRVKVELLREPVRESAAGFGSCFP